MYIYISVYMYQCINELVFIFWVSGGAELLFDKVKKHDVELPASETKCKFINL